MAKFVPLKKKLSHIAIESGKEYELTLVDSNWTVKGFFETIQIQPRRWDEPIEVVFTFVVSEYESHE